MFKGELKTKFIFAKKLDISYYLSIIFGKSFLDIKIIYAQYGISSAILPFYRQLKSFLFLASFMGNIKIRSQHSLGYKKIQ